MAAHFRIPVDDHYALLLGRAVYNFAYYEGIVVWVLEKLEPGYLNKYVSKKDTSGNVANAWESLLKKRPLSDREKQNRLEACLVIFRTLTVERNSLLHAHPYTADDNVQQLGYSKHWSKVEWSTQDIERAALEFEEAATELSGLFYQIWPVP